MTHRTARRQFLSSAAGMAGAFALAPAALSRTPAARRSEDWFQISLAQWSLHRSLRAGRLDHLDFARFTKETFDIEAVEYVNQFFKDKATDFDYLGEMKKRAQDAGVASLLIMIDGEGSLADESSKKRRTAVENHFKWIAAARFLGCHSIRVNAAGGGDQEEAKRRAGDSLRRLADLADPYDINVIVENHGGYSSDGEWLAGAMKLANHKRVGTLPDFGNFNLGDGRWYDRYKGVRQLMPWAKAVSAKSHDFDQGGEETKTDYLRMMGIVQDAGYRGFVGIEYEGGTMPEVDGIKATKALLERVRDELGGGG
ncbi:MAG: TIM barrel protein [bacterium]|nr:TIM barrel protein [bacterium]